MWVDTGQKLYPNLYVILVGKAGIGKTRAIDVAADIIRQVKDIHLSPTSMTKAALVDCLDEAKTSHFMPNRDLHLWNSMYVMVDELSAFMSKWEHELVAALTKFYDCNPYSEARRIGNVRKAIDNPQLNVICGATPAGLMDLIPPVAWGQGLMSRTILIYSNHTDLKNMLTNQEIPQPSDLLHDLEVLTSIQGGRIVFSQEYDDLFDKWRVGGKKPAPTNPRLSDYCARRETHLLKLSIIACIDWADPFVLTRKHFDQAMAWLLEAEANMGAIFDAGSTIDSRNMDDLVDWMAKVGKPISKHQLVHRATKIFPAHMVRHTIDILYHSGQIDKDAEGNWFLKG